MRILHITPWFPNQDNSYEAIWIKRLIQSISSEHEQFVFHLAVNASNHFRVRKLNDGNVKHRIWYLPIRRWMVIELMNFVLLGYYLLGKNIHKNYDIINFHIAYPQLVYWNVLKLFIKKPVVISEHWSAYHFNFGVEKELPRVQSIFRHDLPLIVVSQSLLADISNFAKRPMSDCYVIPNVIDTDVFYRDRSSSVNHCSFFMLSQWKWPKNPNVIINAFAELIKLHRYRGYMLRIGGYGTQIDEMRKLIDSLGIKDSVVFLGSLSPAEVADEMNRCAAFLHCSEYETFSVVCAEALSCGAPVIASNVGGIRELVTHNRGVLIGQNLPGDWFSALAEFEFEKFDRSEISGYAHEKFSSEKVGLLYAGVLRKIINAGK